MFTEITSLQILDSISYNMLSADKRETEDAPQLLHSTCWAHILHLCAEDIRFLLKIADEFIATDKRILLVRTTVKNYIQHL